MSNHASDRLKRNSEKIMKVWEDRANTEVLAALKIESLALRNSLPELLKQIADALSTTIDRTALRIKWDRSESLRVGRKHGSERAGSLSYTMDQMIFEYHILRQVICDVLEEQAPLTPVEREVIVCAIEQAVNDAATQFSETLRGLREKMAMTLTHDLRGPMTSAKLNAQMILRRVEDQAHTKLAATRISNGMDRLDSMLHDLLDISMIRAGQQMPLQFEECDLLVLAKQVAEDFNVTYGERLVVKSDGESRGYWSKNSLLRVLENLATNAAKYGTSNTPITISIQGRGANVVFSVHNEGKSIPLEEQAKIFQQFRRADAAKDQKGWGLGLTVVKGLTEAHHGTVSIESAEGKGTTFTIELPKDSRTRNVTPSAPQTSP